ncbi:MAG: SusC/RagA family TonB-linked outer membrane protein [Bacteroidia bacterium]|nr:SusC/RagA family TonB-linked outer membrane protein [Bacteroidia bacterium]
MKYSAKKIVIALTLVVGFCTTETTAQNIPDTVLVSKSKKINILFGKQDYNRFVGNTDAVKGEELSSTPSSTALEALAGKLPGLFMLQNNGNPGENNFDMYVRGISGGYITLVDGVERALTAYDQAQIAEVRILKDPVSKALYGGRTCNGIIMVTTKRGSQGKPKFTASIQRGVKYATELPNYMNSFDYATNYNQALMNDNNGVLPTNKGEYSQETLDAYQYKTSPIQFPDVDYYGQFLRDYMDYTRVIAEYAGGNEKTNYYVHGSYKNEGNYEAYGDNKRKNQTFILQGNVSSQYSKDIKLHANLATILAEKQYPGSFGFSTLSSRYPNAYPIFIKPGTDTIGGTSTLLDNPYGGQALSGYQRETTLRIQADIALNVNLSGFLKGLTWNPSFNFDIYHLQNLNKVNTFGVYKALSFDFDGNVTSIQTLREEKKATSQSMGSNAYTQRWAFANTFNYDRTFGEHAVTADLFYFMSELNTAADLYDYKRQNLGLRVNYTYADKYSIEGVANYTGSQIMAPDKRFRTFPAIGAGWTVSNEDFLKNNKTVNFLKLNASWGIMGDDNLTPNLWRQTWYYNKWAPNIFVFNTASAGTTTNVVRPGSTVLDWPKMREIDLSIEATLFNSLNFKVSCFDYLNYDQISKLSNVLPAISGGSNFISESNYLQTGLRGYEAQFTYSGKVEDFRYSVGANITYGKTRKIAVDELPDPNYTTVGNATDDILGYHAIGFYTQDDINNMIAGTMAKPSFMDSKDLKVGNILYEDKNNDKIIDQYDRVVIGNSSPRMMYGGNLKLAYKGLELYAMVLGYGDYNPYLSSYFQNYSTRKYSTTIVNGLPNGNVHPMLTAGAGTNDYQTGSDYWIADASFLKLKNLSLSYSLPNSWVKALKMSDLKISVYGTDLFTLSKIKDLDPESFDAGVNSYPLFSTYAVGLSMSF